MPNSDLQGWRQRRDWYLRWGKASNSERLRIVWHEHRALSITILLALAAVGSWLLWSYIAEVGSWLGRYSEEIRNLMLAVGVGAAMFGGWVAYQRSRTDRIRAETDRSRQVTESFAKAVELLGHENLAVRLGAIYALERIARQNRDEHWPIMETLTAYVREWSQRKRLEIAETEDDEIKRGEPVSDLKAAPADIQAVFTVLGRRRLDHERDGSSARRRLDLTGAYLVGADPNPPPGREFARLVLNDANLSGAKLRRANFEKADLARAKLPGAELQRANLEGADLEGANLNEANLSEANLNGAYLAGAQLNEASLSGADLTGASLTSANLQYAGLGRACLKGTYIDEANLFGASLTQEQLNSAIGDKDTKLPKGPTRPAHWSS